MPTVQTPVPYELTYDFAHQASLGQPVNGSQLAIQLVDIARFCAEVRAYLVAMFNEDGTLKAYSSAPPANTGDVAALVAEARLSEEQAYLWAQYLAGPVVPTQPGQTIDDGYFSAKYWALQAAEYYNGTRNFTITKGSELPDAYDIAAINGTVDFTFVVVNGQTCKMRLADLAALIKLINTP